MTLIPESEWESEAIGQWLSLGPARAVRRGDGVRVEFALEAAPGWLPPGRWVRDRRSGQVCQVLPWPGFGVVFVRYPGSCNPGERRPDELEPWVPRVGERVGTHATASARLPGDWIVESIRGVPGQLLVDLCGVDGGHLVAGIPAMDLEPRFKPPAPARPAPRVVRVPAPGRRVRVTMRPLGAPAWTRENEAAGFRCWPSPEVLPRHGDGYSPGAAPEDVEPIGDDPRWMTIELPAKKGNE